jgi:hypothetical protein
MVRLMPLLPVEGGKRFQSTSWVGSCLLLLLLQFVLMPVQATTTATATTTTTTTTTTGLPWSTKSSSGTEYPLVNVTVPASSTSSLTIVLQDIPENGGTIDLTSVTFQSPKDKDENDRTNTTTATEYSVVRQKNYYHLTFVCCCCCRWCWSCWCCCWHFRVCVLFFLLHLYTYLHYCSSLNTSTIQSDDTLFSWMFCIFPFPISVIYMVPVPWNGLNGDWVPLLLEQ